MAMQPGMITSIEPGVYRTGKWGVRIENLVLAVPVETPEAAPPPKKIPPNEVKEPAPDNAASAGPSGPTIQLGAYGSTVKADTAWKLLAGRFPEVAALNKAVVTATVGGKTVVRLRATGSSDQTRAACAALKAAGESCLPVN